MDEEKKHPKREVQAAQPEEVQHKDFQLVLRALLDAYRPVLETNLELAKDAKRLQEEAIPRCPPSCEEELALANQIVSKFLTKDVALALLPEDARQRFRSEERRVGKEGRCRLATGQ